MGVRVWIFVGSLWAVLVSAALAGDNNTLYLTQTNDGSDYGNSFFADQSHSTGSTITATQTGAGNVARIVTSNLCSSSLTIPCGRVELRQNNSGQYSGESALFADGVPARNYVSISSSGNSLATVKQDGDGNGATLNVISGQGTITQSGNDNAASLTVRDGTTGTIIQNNDHNTAALDVTGARGAGASLTQNGNQTYSGPVVIDTLVPGTVTIIQN